MFIGRTNTDSSRLDCYDRTRLQVCPIAIEGHQAGGSLLRGGQNHQPNNSGMGLTPHHRKFTEIFVERDENPTLSMGQGQDFIIARISRPVSRPDDIVPCGFQRIDRTTPDAGIKQEFHEAGSRGRGSIRS
jgi:hypothetical protein